MPINTKTKAKPRVTKTPIIKPRIEGRRGAVRSEIRAFIAGVPTKFRTGLVAELIRDIEVDLMHRRDLRRLSKRFEILVWMLKCEEREEAARLNGMSGLRGGISTICSAQQ
jgi:hypothetical protein